ncbi:MAG TPA: hypothetical protein VE986_06520, partial [Hyphomicrobiales bacterium]|nr:hypothetical protein [Hyphomicrobiales bacterium]
ALGSNDADGPTADLGKHIDNIVQAAARKNIKLVWIGPHCVRRRWDAKARELDAYLNNELSARNVAYVSMRDPEICSGRFYTGDGVHLTMQGYSLIWEKARAVAGLPDAREPKSSTLASVAQPPEKAEGEKPHKKKHAEKAEDDEPKKHRMKPAAERRRRERSFFSLFD